MELRTALDLLLARRQAGLRQYELAARLGISPTIICDLENGRRNISPAMADRLQRALEKAPQAVEA